MTAFHGTNPGTMRNYYLIALLSLSLGCARKTAVVDTAAYEHEIEAWRSERVTNLLAPDGWVALAGLFWLHPGANTVGGDSSLSIVFPPGASRHLGKIYLQNDSVWADYLPAAGVTIDGQATTYALLYPTAGPVFMEQGPFRWTLIQRGDRYGIRLWDTSLPSRIRLAAIPSYPIDPAWRRPARFIPAPRPDTLMMRNALGMDVEVPVEGWVEFSIGKQTYRLHAQDGGPEELFLIFSDETTGETTYGGGRYLYIPRPDANGRTVIDFNKAYNPPCVFTAFATCLLPSAEDHLPVAVTAGEMDDGNLH